MLFRSQVRFEAPDGTEHVTWCPCPSKQQIEVGELHRVRYRKVNPLEAQWVASATRRDWLVGVPMAAVYLTFLYIGTVNSPWYINVFLWSFFALIGWVFWVRE